MKKRLSLFFSAFLLFTSARAGFIDFFHHNDPRSTVLLCAGIAATGGGIYLLLKNSAKKFNKTVNVIGGTSLIGAGILTILGSKNLPGGFDNLVSTIQQEIQKNQR